MAYKDILVYADAAKTAPTRLDVAAKIAAAHNARLIALHVSTPPFIPVDMGTGIPTALIEAQEEFQRELAAAALQAVEAAKRRSGLEIEYRLVRGDMGAVASLHSRYADLIVVSQSGVEPTEPMETDVLPETIVMGAGRPVLIVPRYGNFSTVGERVLIAWNRTRESTRAVHDALPLLAKAKSVVVMEVNPAHGDNAHISGSDIALHLARHGVRADVSSLAAGDIDEGNAILSRLTDLGSDLLVMGAYGHSRLREITLGGVTREVLDHMTVPVLMSH